MKRNASFAVLLLVWLAVVGCAGGGGQDAGREATPERSGPVPANGEREPGASVVAEAGCARALRGPEPSRAAPGGAFRVRGEGFTTGCYDTGQPGRPPPQRAIPIDFRQGGRTWRLATVDADREGTLDAGLEVPNDAKAGSAAVVVRADGHPIKRPFRVLAGAGAAQGPTEMGPPERGVSGGDSAACAGSAPVDLVADGTVEKVGVGSDSSLVEIRLDRVLEGKAGDTILVRTNSGTGAVAEGDVGFREGVGYRLRLQRQGDVFTTNACLGTRAE